MKLKLYVVVQKSKNFKKYEDKKYFQKHKYFLR